MITFKEYIAADRQTVKTRHYSGGEVQVIVELLQEENQLLYNMIARLNHGDDIMELLLFDEILKRHNMSPSIIIPYLPYGRQDRVTQSWESFSLKVMAKLLNDTCFKKIITYDCHSPVTPALIDKLQEVTQAEIFKLHHGEFFLNIINESVLIAPDAGAAKKIYDVAKVFNRPVIVAEKVRNTATGEITATRVHCNPTGGSALIVDDICDGGKTFTELARILKIKGFEKVYLYVTHGIFAHGLQVFDGLIDHIFTTNTIQPHQEHPKLTVIMDVE